MIFSHFKQAVAAFEGNCPTSDYFSFVEPGVLFAMSVDSATQPATAAWVVIPKDHPAYEAIVNHGESARLVHADDWAREFASLLGHEYRQADIGIVKAAMHTIAYEIADNFEGGAHREEILAFLRRGDGT